MFGHCIKFGKEAVQEQENLRRLQRARHAREINDVCKHDRDIREAVGDRRFQALQPGCHWLREHIQEEPLGPLLFFTEPRMCFLKPESRFLALYKSEPEQRVDQSGHCSEVQRKEYDACGEWNLGRPRRHPGELVIDIAGGQHQHNVSNNPRDGFACGIQEDCAYRGEQPP